MDVLTTNNEHRSFNIENGISKFHCQKCGRRSRSYHNYVKKRRLHSEQRHGQHSKCERRQERLFPTNLLPYPIIALTNDNHSISKNIRSQNSLRNSSRKNVIIDQLIHVKQLDTRKCKTRRDGYNMDNDDSKKNDQIVAETSNSNTLNRLQQIVYLRENINNLTYREVHFSKEFIILKRLEEKNHYMHQTRFNADHYLRSFKLQYQTMSMLLQNFTITTFIYSKQESSIQIPWKQSSSFTNPDLNELKDYSTLPKEGCLHSMLEINDTSTNESLSHTDRTDSLVLPTPHNIKKSLQYSQNATQPCVNTDRSHQIRTQNLVFDTAVIVDVTKCPQMIPTEVNYVDQQQILTDSVFSDRINHQLLFNIPCETSWFPSNAQQSNDLQLLSTTDTSSSIRPSSESEKTNSNRTHTTTNTDSHQSMRYIQVITQIKQILNRLKYRPLSKSLNNNRNMNISIPSAQITSVNINRVSNQIDRSLSATMTSDSLLSDTSIPTTYSVSSTLNKNTCQFEFDSLNEYRTATKFHVLNSAKNINTNQQASDDDDDDPTKRPLHYIQTRRRNNMSLSFMFVLQILLIIGLLNRFLMSYLFGIVPMDSLASVILDHSPAVTSTASTYSTRTEPTNLFDHFFAALF